MDDDWSFLTGGLGDLNGNGKVDFSEAVNEMHDYDRIMNGGSAQRKVNGRSGENVKVREIVFYFVTAIWFFVAGMLLDLKELERIGIIKTYVTYEMCEQAAAAGFAMAGVAVLVFVAVKLYKHRHK